jgi:type III secretion system low calcium response chaperone LcrH/SycD
MAANLAVKTVQGTDPAGLRSAAAALPSHERFSDEQIAGLYAVGYDLCAQGQYDKAVSFLILAALYRPGERNYMLALGICHKALKQHARAIQAFSMATALDPTNPDAALHVAECLLALKRRDEAESLLASVVECARLGGRHEAVLRRAEVILAQVRKP